MIKIILKTNVKVSDVYGNTYGFSEIINTKNGEYCYYETSCYQNHYNDLIKYFDYKEIYHIEVIHTAKKFNNLQKFADTGITFNNIEESLKHLKIRIKNES